MFHPLPSQGAEPPINARAELKQQFADGKLTNEQYYQQARPHLPIT